MQGSIRTRPVEREGKNEGRTNRRFRRLVMEISFRRMRSVLVQRRVKLEEAPLPMYCSRLQGIRRVERDGRFERVRGELARSSQGGLERDVEGDSKGFRGV